MLDAQSIGLDELLETRMVLELPLAGLAAQRASEQDVVVLRALVETSTQPRTTTRERSRTTPAFTT
jgi:DNA-binding FadR family transcriptional regulator